jgi:hypothetical protein
MQVWKARRRRLPLSREPRGGGHTLQLRRVFTMPDGQLLRAAAERVGEHTGIREPGQSRRASTSRDVRTLRPGAVPV